MALHRIDLFYHGFELHALDPQLGGMQSRLRPTARAIYRGVRRKQPYADFNAALNLLVYDEIHWNREELVPRILGGVECHLRAQGLTFMTLPCGAQGRFPRRIAPVPRDAVSVRTRNAGPCLSGGDGVGPSGSDLERGQVDRSGRTPDRSTCGPRRFVGAPFRRTQRHALQRAAVGRDVRQVSGRAERVSPAQSRRRPIDRNEKPTNLPVIAGADRLLGAQGERKAP